MANNKGRSTLILDGLSPAKTAKRAETHNSLKRPQATLKRSFSSGYTRLVLYFVFSASWGFLLGQRQGRQVAEGWLLIQSNTHATAPHNLHRQADSPSKCCQWGYKASGGRFGIVRLPHLQYWKSSKSKLNGIQTCVLVIRGLVVATLLGVCAVSQT